LDDTSSDGHATDRRRANGSFSRTFTSTPASIARVRAALAGYATQVGAGVPVVEAVRLAVSEAATNVVVHAYSDAGESGLIEVEASVDGDALNVGIADSGTGLRRRRDSPGLGLGLAIIGELADDVELLQGEDGGLRVLMRFALAAAPDAA
jgi:serine/threonine-protein kinase RsbW